MIRVTESVRAALPARLLEVLRDRRASWRDARHYFNICRQFSNNQFGGSLRSSMRSAFWPRRTILFFPERPPDSGVEFKLCALLGCAITSNPSRKFDVAFKRKDATFFDQTLLQMVPVSEKQIINAGSVDVSKRTLGEAFGAVFGYGLEVDPTVHHGYIVEKSNENATHDGRIISGPISPHQKRLGCVYQKLIDNSSKDGLVLDYRLPVHGDLIPLVYLKYRPMETRFSNTNAFVELKEPNAVFLPAELAHVLLLARRMGIDYGEFDVLRDRDGRMYVVDANSTPDGPPNGLPEGETRVALKRLAESFDRLLERWASPSNTRTRAILSRASLCPPAQPSPLS